MIIIRPDHPTFTDYRSQLRRTDLWNYPTYADFEDELMREYLPESRLEDVSMVATKKDIPIAGIMATIHTQGEEQPMLDCYGKPVQYVEDLEQPESDRKGAVKSLKAAYNDLIRSRGITRVSFRERGTVLSPFAVHLLQTGGTVKPFLTQIIDLSKSEAELRNGLRKSYRSLINWGLKHMQIRVLADKTAEPEDLEAFRLLHLAAAGRETRSRRTWEIQYEQVVQSEGFAVFAEWKDRLVSAAFCNVSNKTCYYGVGASDRALFDKPIGHAVIWTAILQAKQLGCRYFDAGEQLFPGINDKSRKEQAISTFKRGFGGQTYTWLDIEWQA